MLCDVELWWYIKISMKLQWYEMVNLSAPFGIFHRWNDYHGMHGVTRLPSADIKDHVAHMGLTWVLLAPGGLHQAPWTLLSGSLYPWPVTLCLIMQFNPLPLAINVISWCRALVDHWYQGDLVPMYYKNCYKACVCFDMIISTTIYSHYCLSF